MASLRANEDDGSLIPPPNTRPFLCPLLCPFLLSSYALSSAPFVLSSYALSYALLLSSYDRSLWPPPGAPWPLICPLLGFSLGAPFSLGCFLGWPRPFPMLS